MSKNRATIRMIAIIGLALIIAPPALAGQAEAKEEARLNNCAPKKIEVIQNAPGSQGKTVYKVACNLPKIASTDSNANAPDALLIGCNQSLCDLIRPIVANKN